MTRPDLLALNEDALVALANRGLVKRAAKETAVAVEIDGDGTVRGQFPDGASVVLPVGIGLAAANCSCGAAGMCRHRIALVLAYQKESAAPTDFRPWSPASLSDELLAAEFGERVLAAARKSYRAGFPVRLRRPTVEDPIASAELPLCTVRFLVPGELGYVHTDVAAAKRDEFVVLAVWAFREADERGSLEFEAGGSSDDGVDFGAALELVDQLLVDGAVNASPVQEAALRRAQRELTDRNLHWPAAAMAELVDQLGAYRSRTAEYDPARFAALITELHARHRATGPRSQVLGTDERAETPLSRVRLTALGGRIRDEQSAEVYLAGPTAVFVLRHRWEKADASVSHQVNGAAATAVAKRRVAGTTLGRLAVANVVSESAVRSASRVVRLAASRVSKTSITPIGDAWSELPDSILSGDFARLDRELAALPPSFVRARVEAELVRVLAVAEVQAVGYDPGSQRLDAVIADAAGATATVSAQYNRFCPAAVDVLAKALADGPRMIAGSVRRVRGGVVIDPCAVFTADGVVVPDLADGEPTVLADRAWAELDPVSAAIASALEVSAEAAHRGLRHVTDGVRTRLDQAAAGLRRVGLPRTADLLAAATDPDTWPTAHTRLLLLADLNPGESRSQTHRM